MQIDYYCDYGNGIINRLEECIKNILLLSDIIHEVSSSVKGLAVGFKVHGGQEDENYQ